MTDKKADLAGPGISTYEEVEKILPTDYEPILNPKDRMKAVTMDCMATLRRCRFGTSPVRPV